MNKPNDQDDEPEGDDTGGIGQFLHQNQNPQTRLDGSSFSSSPPQPPPSQEAVKHNKDDENTKREEDAADEDEEETKKKIDKAIKFWRHPMLHNVSMEEKRAYLHDRGVTDEILYKAWDKMVDMDVLDGAAASASNTKNNAALITGPPQLGGIDGIGRGDRNTLPSMDIGVTNGDSAAQAATMPHHSYGYGNNNNSSGCHQNPPPNQHAGGVGGYPYHDASYPYNNQTVHNGGGYDYDDHNENGHIISATHGVSLLAAGGLIGLTAAAAVRWLNGGEFEIFPPMMVEAEQQHQLHQQQQGDTTTAADLDEQNSRNQLEAGIRNDNFDDDGCDEQQIDDNDDDDDDDNNDHH
mmetsp:Transcript_4406/g.11032  ORF Transcript_4406/g.11032 Transcript_4406/m.11032 type:complete len:351 (+) Transcript_4406:145-1197(+)